MGGAVELALCREARRAMRPLRARRTLKESTSPREDASLDSRIERGSDHVKTLKPTLSGQRARRERSTNEGASVNRKKL